MEKPIFIYGLHNEDNVIRYIGKTSKKDVRLRLQQHILNSKHKKTHKDQWIQKNLSENKIINITIIEITDDVNWMEREKFWIKHYRDQNCELTNTSDGGEGGCGIKYTKSYEEVKNWVHKNCSFKSSNDWEKNIKNTEKPDFIPISPRETYLTRGWISWMDFLNTKNNNSNIINYITYNEAKEYIKENLSNIKTQENWKDSIKEGKIPENIPNRPDRYYNNKDRGWISWSNYLDSKNIANINKEFCNYKEARMYCISLNINSRTKWINFCKNDLKPVNIPSNPDKHYKNNGWVSWGSFFGTGHISDNKKNKNYFSYKESKKYIKENLNFIKSSVQWEKYIKTNDVNIPQSIPRNPQLSYKNKGWIGWGEYLETGNIMNKDKIFPSFNEAREIVQNYNIKSNKEWRIFSKQECKTLKLHTAPDQFYKNKGWISWMDFLGKNKNKKNSLT